MDLVMPPYFNLEQVLIESGGWWASLLANPIFESYHDDERYIHLYWRCYGVSSNDYWHNYGTGYHFSVPHDVPWLRKILIPMWRGIIWFFITVADYEARHNKDSNWLSDNFEEIDEFIDLYSPKAIRTYMDNVKISLQIRPINGLWFGDKSLEDIAEIVLGRLVVLEQAVNEHKQKKEKTHGYVYLVKSVTGFYKIGRSKNPNNRFKTFGVKLPFEVELEHTFFTQNYFKAEKELHRKFKNKRVNGEWFALSDEDVEYIKSIES